MNNQSETKNCQNCKKDFTIEPEDFNFYEKIKVPPPTWCSECRMSRRLIWRNMRSMYKRECALCKKSLISCYRDDGCPVYCADCFNGDAWDPYMYARDIDWSRDFLSQIYDVFILQPRIYQFRIGNVVNSDYGNAIINSKNVYMCFSSLYNEDVMYCENIDRCRNTIDSFSVSDLEQCSYNILSNKNYNSHYMLSSSTCIDSNFLYDCMNCQHCTMSSNLRNQQYVFRNQKLSKEDYQIAVESLGLNKYSGFNKAQIEFDELYKKAIHEYAQIVSSQNVYGNIISNSKNIFKSFDVHESSEDIRYSMRLIKCKDIFDCAFAVAGEFSYECLAVSNNTYNQVFSMNCNGSKNMIYSMFCKNSSDCFGCVGLTNAKFCILNKQYEKDEYLKIIEKLKTHMADMPYVDKKDRVYRYGQFFPFEMSPFTYNESISIDYFPINRAEAALLDYPWREKEKKNYTGMIKGDDIPDDIMDVQDSILNKIIACPNNGKQEFQCTTAFKIIAEELRFYRDKKIPLPRFCSNCRHYQRLVYRNPMKLWHRKCMKEGCNNEFETSYAPDRPEKVYCEKCYQNEVY